MTSSRAVASSRASIEVGVSQRRGLPGSARPLSSSVISDSDSVDLFRRRTKSLDRYLQLNLALDRPMSYPPSTNEVDQSQQPENDPLRGSCRGGSVVSAWRPPDTADRRRPSPRWEVCALVL